MSSGLTYLGGCLHRGRTDRVIRPSGNPICAWDLRHTEGIRVVLLLTSEEIIFLHPPSCTVRHSCHASISIFHSCPIGHKFNACSG
jgi:hypothetical protein